MCFRTVLTHIWDTEKKETFFSYLSSLEFLSSSYSLIWKSADLDCIFIFILEKRFFWITKITRRVVKPASSSTSETASGNILQSNTNDRDDRDKDDERDSDDDKETRLTLMEEVLLLGLKDREVC
jgi:hypothetical protein